MIRMLQNIDINSVAGIWLKANLNAHYFISKHYWVSNYELVKKMLAQAEVYVYEDDKIIQGFVGLNNEYIQCKGLDETTGEKEYTMLWKQK